MTAGVGGVLIGLERPFDVFPAPLVEALELVGTWAPARLGCQVKHGSGRVGIVGGELGVDG